MTSLTRLSLANRMIVGLATLAIIVFGVLATLNLKQELLPSIQVPTAIVTASYPGVSPQIVADDVSTPLERALTGVSGVTKVQSTSTNGTATITVEWEYGLDPDKVVADIRNAVDGVAPTLPEEVETEVLTGSTDDIPCYCWPSHRTHPWTKPVVRSRTWRSRSCRESTAYAVSP